MTCLLAWREDDGHGGVGEVEAGDALYVPPLSVLQDVVEVRGAFNGTPESSKTSVAGKATIVQRFELAQGERVRDVVLKAGGGVDDSARISGIYEASQGYYVNVGAKARVISIGSEIIAQMPVSEYFLEADAIINLPKAKTHMIAGITCCVKNMFGAVVGSAKAKIHYDAGHAKRFTQFLVDLYKYFKPTLNIVEALTIMEGDGPTHGKIREGGKIIAGTSGVEVDAVVASMMGFQLNRLKFLQLASQAGLGECDLGKIEVVGDFEPWPNFELPSTYSGRPMDNIQVAQAAEIHEVWGQVGRLHPRFIEENCTACGSCAEICPAGAIALDPYPVVDEAKCVSCFCCAEVCPEAALVMPKEEAQTLFLRLNPQIREG